MSFSFFMIHSFVLKKSRNNPVQPLWSKQFWAFVSFMLETQLNQMLSPLGDSTASSGYRVLLCSSCRSRVMLPSCSCNSVEGQSFALCCFTKVTIICLFTEVEETISSAGLGAFISNTPTTRGTHGLTGGGPSVLWQAER